LSTNAQQEISGGSWSLWSRGMFPAEIGNNQKSSVNTVHFSASKLMKILQFTWKKCTWLSFI